MQACSSVSMHSSGPLGEGTRRRRKKHINQPNENIPTDTKTSYCDIKMLGVVGGGGGDRDRFLDEGMRKERL